MTRTDILLDGDLDLILENGDFLLGESDGQHAQLLLLSSEGDFTQFPKLGVGVTKYLKGSFDGAARRNVHLQFESDNYTIKNLDFDAQTGKANIDFK